MKRTSVVVAGGLHVGGAHAPLLIAGPCVMESRAQCLEIACFCAEAAAAHGFSYIFKSSFDKANRTSMGSFRGPGLQRGLDILGAVKDKLGVAVLTDVHETSQVAAAAAVADVLQIPALLCRQTDLVTAAAESGKAVNLKKGQFLSPEEMAFVAAKARSTGNKNILLTERGTFFGYGRLVADMEGLWRLRSLGYPVIFDATHSAQRPAGLGDRSGGSREAALVLARAATAAGCDGLFIEVHPRPSKAKSDAATSLDFKLLEAALGQTAAIYRALGKSASSRRS